MHFLRILLPVFCFGFVVVSSSCEDETETNRKGILGDWELVKGLRNKKETESLAGATFHFGPDGKMSTNLPIGIESPANYDVNKNIISQLGRQTVKYTIVSFSDTSLVLELQMRGTDFEMTLRRAVAPPPDGEEPE